MKTAITTLGLSGWLVSYLLFWQYLEAHDWNILRGWIDAFTANDWATGLLVDLVAVSLMVVLLALDNRKRFGPIWVATIIASLSLSASMALAMCLVAFWQTEAPPRSQPQADAR